MKKFLLYSFVCIPVFFYCHNMAIAQSGILFHKGLFLSSDSLYNAGEYQKAIESRLSKIEQKGDRIGSDSYIIAQCYALLEMPDSAFYYLNRYVDGTNKDYRSVFVDEDFGLLRKNKTEWAKISDRIEDTFLKDLEAPINKEYALELFRLGTEYLRYSFTDISYKRTEEPSPRQIWRKQTKVRKDFDKLVRKYGFPTPSKVGYDATGFTLDIMLYPGIEEKYYLMAKKAFEDGDYLSVNFAWITDRWLNQNGKRQLYGTVFSSELSFDGSRTSVLMPVEDFKNLNKRRAEIGLQTIEEDAKMIRAVIPEEHYSEGGNK